MAMQRSRAHQPTAKVELRQDSEQPDSSNDEYGALLGSGLGTRARLHRSIVGLLLPVLNRVLAPNDEG